MPSDATTLRVLRSLALATLVTAGTLIVALPSPSRASPPRASAAGQPVARPASTPNPAAYRALAPARLVDTRPDGTTIDGQQQGGPPWVREAPSTSTRSDGAVSPRPACRRWS